MAFDADMPVLLQIVYFACCLSSDGLNTAHVVLILHACFADTSVMNSPPNTKPKHKTPTKLASQQCRCITQGTSVWYFCWRSSLQI